MHYSLSVQCEKISLKKCKIQKLFCLLLYLYVVLEV